MLPVLSPLANEAQGIATQLGCPLAYRLAGPPDGPRVLFIQGTGLHGDGWLPQVEGLAATHRCLWFDNRGIGKSLPAGPARITVEQMAEDALAVMDATGWEAAHVAGHSLGGLIALHLALNHRPRVRSLSLLCTFAKGADATRMTPRMFWLGLRTYIGTRSMRRRAFTHIVLPPEPSLTPAERDAWAARLAPIFGHDLADHPPIVMKQLAAMRAYDATPRLGELAGMPALVLGAKDDPIARPEVVQRLAAGIPGSRLVTYDDASHGVTVQWAGRVNEVLREWME